MSTRDRHQDEQDQSLDVCERCGATEHVHRGLCRRCHELLVGEGRRIAAERPRPPHQPEPQPPRQPPWRRRGA